jgi:hypothetical protein
MTNNLPDIYLFNPTCEYAVANGKTSWQPNRLLQKMEADLGFLSLYLANKNDFILVNRMPSAEFLKRVSALKPGLPDFITKDEIKKPTFPAFKINSLKPWGWSPAAHKLLSPLKAHCAEGFQKSPVFNWTNEHKEIYSKRFALKILCRLTNTIKTDYAISEDQIPVICKSQDEVESQLSKWENIMVKAPWSSSGRGLQSVTKTPVHVKVWEKINGIIKEQGFVMVEPYLNKVLDFSFQFELKNKKLKFLGISNFSTDKKGQYQGNYLNGLPDNISENIRMFQKKAISDILPNLIPILENSELAVLYEGNFSVDTLTYATINNELKINPCLEINVRQNMGLLSLQLEKLLVNNRKAVFRTFYDPGKSLKTFVAEMEEKHPLRISGNQLDAGFFPLTEVSDDRLFGAYLLA